MQTCPCWCTQVIDTNVSLQGFFTPILYPPPEPAPRKENTHQKLRRLTCFLFVSFSSLSLFRLPLHPLRLGLRILLLPTWVSLASAQKNANLFQARGFGFVFPSVQTNEETRHITQSISSDIKSFQNSKKHGKHSQNPKPEKKMKKHGHLRNLSFRKPKKNELFFQPGRSLLVIVFLFFRCPGDSSAPRSLLSGAKGTSPGLSHPKELQ